MQHNKAELKPREILGSNITSLILNLDSDWDMPTYMKWVAHWKLVYKELTRGSRLAKKWRKTSLIPQDKQEVSQARSNEHREMRLLASELLNLRKQAKILAEQAYKRGR